MSERREAEKTGKKAQMREQDKERLDLAVEKLTSGKRMTFDEFILAQRVVSDDKKRAKRKAPTEEDIEPIAETTEEEAATDEQTEDEKQ
jgi:hypothetical protein